ncbi:hypothetical protein GCM10027445_53670 [Amycolatopsis endophytica]|uniref:Uncharacterized protein n=1 Tax=Amycolatopsis endophytica TaxID=860233 RepID=A0A853AVZ2_9PSEU|nr:hypothetical protein [Amycolatopsis endophytica]NYI86794.1 hypothetical protein [Amycolatopsis endophytica]
MGKGVPRRLPSADFNLGGEQAEADPLLQSAFFQSSQYASLVSRDEPKCFIVGRTGSGKSAMLQRVEEDHPDHVIRINPEDLSLPYISDLGVVRFLAAMDVHLDPFFIALWKHVLLVEIIRHRYKVNSPAAKQNFLVSLRDRVSRDKSKMAALEYLDDFDGKFWCETDERVRDITTKFEEQVKKEAGGKIAAAPFDANATFGGSALYGEETKAQQAERFQRIVNETQLPRLNKMIGVLDEHILESPQNYTYVVIDDLDRDWVDEKILNSLIRCLFRAVLDLKRVRNLKVLVALRTNIFEQLNFGTRTGGQEEKFRSVKMTLRWSSRELQELVVTRASSAAEMRQLDTVESIKDLLPATNPSRGNPFDYMLRRTLMRPRDIISCFNACYSISNNKRLTWETIVEAERTYSRDRLFALRDEWKPSYFDIDRVFWVFDSAPIKMNRKEFFERLDEAFLLPADPDFGGVVWVTEMSEAFWSGSQVGDAGREYHPLTRLLFDIGFIGCIRKSGTEIYAYDSPEYMDRASAMEDVAQFCVHPAFRLALDIKPDRR